MTFSPRGSTAPPARERTVLGIDLGTSSVKALLATQDGEAGSGSASYEIRMPHPGQAETDPGDWWRATRTAVRQATADRAAPEAIAVVGQMHGVVLTAASGDPIRPAIVWLDRRAELEAAGFPADSAGNPSSPGMAGPILRWLRAYEPQACHSAAWALQPKDWLRMRLTGEAATDPTDASATLLYDPVANHWVTADPLLPPILPSRTVAGHLREDVARELGLRPGIPVAVGAADTAASLLAADMHGPGWTLLVLGTGGQWVVPVPADAAPDSTGRTNLFRAVGDGAYRLAGVQNVGIALDWVRRLLGATWPELYETAALGSVDAPLFLPYLVPERFGITRAAQWSGLTLSHTRQDLMRAALTGVADLLREHLDNLRAAGADPEHVLLAGGGSQNAAWRDLLSATFGLPLHESAVSGLSVRGATMIAHYALQGEDKPRHHDP